MNLPLKFLIASCLAFTSCGKRHTLTLTSPDGSCVIRGTEKECKIKTGTETVWLCADSEPAWQAKDLNLTLDGKPLDLPDSIVRRIAEPSKLTLSVLRHSPVETTVFLDRENMAIGLRKLELIYKENKLAYALADAVDEPPIRIFP